MLESSKSKSLYPLKIISILNTNYINKSNRATRKTKRFSLLGNMPRVKQVLNFDNNDTAKRLCQKRRSCQLNDLDGLKSEDNYEREYEDEADSNSLIHHHGHKVIKLSAKTSSSLPITTSNADDSFNLDSYAFLDKQELSEKHLWLLTNAYDHLSEWKSLAMSLNLSRQDIDLIEFNYLNSQDGLRECFYQCLLKWRLIQPENCHFSFLCNLLVSKKFNKPSVLIESLAKSMLPSNLLNETYNYAEYNKRSFENYRAMIGPKSNCVETSLFCLNEKHLWTSSEIICLEWKSIARGLGLNESSIADIHLRYARFEGLRECCYQSLLVWSQIDSSNANLEYLCLALIEMRFNLFAKKLLETFL